MQWTLPSIAFLGNIYRFYGMAIQLTDINCFYGAHQALHNINLCCPKGETMVLLGPSGAGKSSLLRVFNLLEIPTTGSMTLAEQSFDFHTKPTEKTIKALRQSVGMVFKQ